MDVVKSYLEPGSWQMMRRLGGYLDYLSLIPLSAQSRWIALIAATD